MAKNTTQFTNRPDVYLDEETGGPENWGRIPMEGEAPETLPNFAPGATENQIYPSETPEAPHAGPQVYEKDPRLGMNPQGEWTQEKIRNMFPGMLPDATADLLDPAEQAKKEKGLPYDASKKYDPTTNEYSQQYKPDPRYAPESQALRGPQPRLRRQDMENEIFRMYGNPFTMDPYGEVVKADSQLPQLFDYVFDGKVAWSDLGRLNKKQREIWEEAKKEFHARTYKEAMGKQQRAENAYKWMMGNYEADAKREEKEMDRLEKAEAARLAAAGKAPHTQELWDEQLQAKTLHQYDPNTGRWISTGQRVGIPGLEDKMPPKVRAAWEVIKAQSKKADPTMMLIAQNMAKTDPEGSKAMMSSMLGTSPEEAENLKQAYLIFNPWFRGQDANLGKSEKPTGPVSAMKTPEQYAMTILQKIQKKDPKVDESIAAFEKAFGTSKPALVAQIKRARQGKPATSAPSAAVGPGAAERAGADFATPPERYSIGSNKGMDLPVEETPTPDFIKGIQLPSAEEIGEAWTPK